MHKVAILVAASPNAAFYSQIAMIRRAITGLEWKRWAPSIHVFLGGEPGDGSFQTWLPHLADVEFVRASTARSALHPIWAQSDDMFRIAPWVADVFLVLDADTLPVSNLEDILDEVHSRGCMAGVIAHDAPPSFQGPHQRDAWQKIASEVGIDQIPFESEYTLLPSSVPEARRRSPFYVNFGVVFFAGPAFARLAPAYLRMRPLLQARMPDAYFSGQVALTLACIEQEVATWPLPIRYNFPNDPGAVKLHPEEAANAVVYHYLRTTNFDRQKVFRSGDDYDRFISQELTGVDLAFRDKVLKMIGRTYPFG